MDYNPIKIPKDSAGWDPTGTSNDPNDPVHGYVDANGNYVAPATREAAQGSYEADVAAQRQRGTQFSATPQLDQTQANQSRGLQMGALGLLGAQANGTAPSSAAITSQRANEDAAMRGAAATVGAKSAGGGIAAFNAAAPAAASQAMSANVQNANARAAEISRGQQAYAGGTQRVEGQDITAATTNAQLAQAQRDLNQQHQQAAEQMGWNIRNQGMQNTGAGVALERQSYAAQDAEQRAKDAQQAGFAHDITSGATGGILGGVGGASHSDERTKTNIRPMTMGSLSHLGGPR